MKQAMLLLKEVREEYAIETFLKGRKMLGSNLAYSTEFRKLIWRDWKCERDD
jgi:hypothetical protein